MTRRRGNGRIPALAALIALAGCQLIADLGGRSVGGESCLHTSDCPEREVCLFKTCADACGNDRDCPKNSRCLDTEQGKGCVSQQSASCEVDQECPPGTLCSDSSCRTPCGIGASTSCLEDQRCLGDVCIGESSEHDDAASTADAGAGGENGSSSGGAAFGGTAGVGAGGRGGASAGGMPGSGGSGGAGSGGASSDAGAGSGGASASGGSGGSSAGGSTSRGGSGGSSGGSAGTGGTTAGTGGTTAGTGGTTAGTGGTTAGTGGTTAGTGGTTAGAGGSMAGTGGRGGAAGSGAGTAGAGGSGGGSTGLSSGCGKAPGISSGMYNNGSTIAITAASLARRYILNVPTTYDNTKPHKLIIAFHEYGGNDKRIYANDYYHLLDLADDNAIFVAPNGQESGAGCTETGDGDTGCGWANPGNTDVALVDAVVDQIEENFCVDTNRIFAVGWSFGAGMSYKMACERPLGATGGYIRGTAVYSGSQLSGNCTPSSPVAYYGSHGTQDTVLTPANGITLAANFASANGCGWTSPTTATSGHVCTDQTGCDAGYPVRFCSFVGGHTPDPDNGEVGSSWQYQVVWDFLDQF